MILLKQKSTFIKYDITEKVKNTKKKKRKSIRLGTKRLHYEANTSK